jgi:hypothetical protein
MAAHYGAYEDAFGTLDDPSWQVLRGKASDHFLDHREGQLKQGFFNQLNDAFAYQHLTSMGCSDIAILAEDGKPCPDISYIDGAGNAFCEVKTINISNDEIERRSSGGVINSGQLYSSLGPTCIKKLNDAIDRAVAQMTKRGAVGLVYILMHFDDFTHDHLDQYRQQISECLALHSARQVVVQVTTLSIVKISKP